MAEDAAKCLRIPELVGIGTAFAPPPIPERRRRRRFVARARSPLDGVRIS
jgi:hypothetical protein